MSATVAITATLLSMWHSPTEAENITGKAAFYREGLMPQVCEARGLDMSAYAGAVALMRRGDLGRTVWVFGEPMLVCDCSNRSHLAMNLERGRVADLDWATWQRHGLPLQPVPITVSFVPPVIGGQRPR